MDDNDEHGSSHGPRMHSIGSGHGRSRVLRIVLMAKLLAIAAAILLFWVLQLEFEIGVTALVLLHLALAGIIVLAWRAGVAGGRST